MHCLDRTKNEVPFQFGPRIPAVGIAIMIIVALFAPHEDEEEVLLTSSLLVSSLVDETALRIRKVVQPPHSTETPFQNPSLRGCCGSPAEFVWIFPDDEVKGSAGNTLSTRLLALDGLGRRASPASAAGVSAQLSLQGHARSSSSVWKDAAMILDIEDDKSETVDAEVRIESPDSDEPLLHQVRIDFSPGPVHGYRVEFSGGVQNWVSGSWLDVAIAASDRFGNPARSGDGTLRVALRANTSQLEVFHPDGGQFVSLDKDGMAHLRVRCKMSGYIMFWVEYWDVLKAVREDLFSSTAQTLRIAEALPMGQWHAGRNLKHDKRWDSVADEVREAFLRAWKAYKRHAWGQDELLPLSRKGQNNWGNVGMTILDSLSTLWLLNCTEEFEDAYQFVDEKLKFDRKDAPVSVFELSIRALGGLLGAHSLSGRPAFLSRAKELAEKLLPAFNTSSGMPVAHWNLKKGKGKKDVADHTSLAEAGSVQLEWRYLSHHTQDPRFREAADRSFNAIQSVQSKSGLLPSRLSSPTTTNVTAQWESSPVTVGGESDSYYEYLLKQWLQSPTELHFKNLWLKFMDGFPELIQPKLTPQEARYKVLGINPDGSLRWQMEHLGCFAGGMVALGLLSLPEKESASRKAEWAALAKGLTASCAEMWTGSATGLGPECTEISPRAPHKMSGVKSHCSHSMLRPETVESLYYLYRLTGDVQYREWGEQIFRALLEHSETDSGGFATVENVMEYGSDKKDEMQSFVMAETFKYLYLLFAPPELLELDTYVLNTEGHPLRRFELGNENI